MDMRNCAFDDCGLLEHGRGYCKTHYNQLLSGKPLHSFTPRLTGVRKRVCQYPSCNQQHQAKGYCDGHYQQLRTGRPLSPLRKYGPRDPLCSFEDCGRPNYSRGLCYTHYDQERRGFKLTVIARQKPQTGPCLVPNCDHDAISLSLCRAHFRARGNFNLSDEQIIELFTDPKCSICGALNSGKRGLHIDHDHSCCPENGKSCGKCVRGLLCVTCNNALGMFHDNIPLIRSAIVYLEQNPRV